MSKQILRALAQQGTDFYNRGWMYGTSGNLSVRMEGPPLRIGVTASGVDKGNLSAEDIVILQDGSPPDPPHLKPSAETSIHLAVYKARSSATSVLHVHTPASTVLSMKAGDGKSLQHVQWTGYEMLKGLGYWEENAVVSIPVFPNHASVQQIACDVGNYLECTSNCPPVFLIWGHGLTAWGESLAQARHRLEIGHFLCECELQAMGS